MAGNQFMVMRPLIDLFKQVHPDVKRIYYQTLPPGLSLQQILAGGARFEDQILPGNQDVYASVNKAAMEKLVTAGMLEPEGLTCYLHNRITLMRIKLGTVEVGPVWATEIQHAREMGMAVAAIAPGDHLDQHDRVNYYSAPLKTARNSTNAYKFIRFITSPAAHADLYDNFEGYRYSNACPFARIMEENLAHKLVQVGIRTLTAHQREQAASWPVEIFEMQAAVRFS